MLSAATSVLPTGQASEDKSGKHSALVMDSKTVTLSDREPGDCLGRMLALWSAKWSAAH